MSFPQVRTNPSVLFHFILTHSLNFVYSVKISFKSWKRALREMLRILEKIQNCDWLAKRGDVLGKHPKTRLRVIFQNISSIRVAKSTLPLVGSISLFRVNS